MTIKQSKESLAIEKEQIDRMKQDLEKAQSEGGYELLHEVAMPGVTMNITPKNE